MKNEIVLVTGASSGIGEACARLLSERGYTVVLSARTKKKLQAIERELTDRGERALAISGDVTKDNDARNVINESLKTFGAIHAIVHSAGVFRMNRVEATSPEEFRQVLDTNLTSLFYLLRHLLPHMYKQQQGRIVAISSILGKEAYPSESAYCASKWGLMGFLKALREEARGHGVTVTAICPGATLTPSWDSYPKPLPEGKLIEAGTVASAVAFALEQPATTCVDELVITPAKGPMEL